MTRPFRCYPRPDQQEPLPLADDKGPYYPDPALARAVCTALAVGQPLLVTGEPGCGKSTVAWSIAAELGLDQQAHQHKRAAVARYHTRSDSQGRDLLYRFDGLRRRDGRSQQCHGGDAGPASEPATTIAGTGGSGANFALDGAVIDLQVRRRRLEATVQGTRRYLVGVDFLPPSALTHQVAAQVRDIRARLPAGPEQTAAIRDAIAGAGPALVRSGCTVLHQRLLLACVELAFDHPVSGERLPIKAPVSGQFAAILARFGWPDTQ